MAASLLTSVFGDKSDIGSIVQSFDFSTINVKDEKSDDFLYVDLAPSFRKRGTDLKQSMRAIDDPLKVMVYATMKMLGAQKDKSWGAVLRTMIQNELVQRDAPEVSRFDQIIKNSSEDFRFDGGYDAGIVREVNSWFRNLISDPDVLASTNIDVGVLAKIISQTGATVDSFDNFFAKDEHHEQTLIDISVLRFPDIDNPYFKLYRIKLIAQFSSSRVLFHSEDRTAITGEYNCHTFRPRTSVMNGLRSTARDMAISEFHEMFC